jgi:nucleolar protein 58
VLAAKCALSVRVDALSQGDVAMVGTSHRSKVEARLRQLEVRRGRGGVSFAQGNVAHQISGSSKGKAKVSKFNATEDVRSSAKKAAFNVGDDAVVEKKKVGGRRWTLTGAEEAGG